MEPMFWIVRSGLAMSTIALVSSLTIVLNKKTLDKILLPMVAFAAGSLIGGAFLHMITACLDGTGGSSFVFIWLIVGFVVFLVFEQFFQWHHRHW